MKSWLCLTRELKLASLILRLVFLLNVQFSEILFFCCFFTEKNVLLQGKIEQMTDIIRRLKVCVKWFQQVDETHVQEKDGLRSSLESAEKRFSDKGDLVFLRYLYISFVSLDADVVPDYL